MNAVIALFPYFCTILALAFVAALRAERPGVWIALIAIAGVIAFAAALIAAARNAARGLTAKQNLAIKCAQIPAYVLNFALAILGVTMSVFGLPMIFWAIAIDFLSILTTGISAIGCGRTLCKTGKIAKTAAAWTTIGSFVYCADVAIAIAWYCWERGNGREIEKTRG